MSTAEDQDEPLFTSAEDIVRCWARGIPSGRKAIPIEREGGTSSLFDRAARLATRTERYAVACGVMKRAEAAGLTEMHQVVLRALFADGQSWDQAAERAGLEDETLQAESVKKRVFRARKDGLRIISGVM